MTVCGYTTTSRNGRIGKRAGVGASVLSVIDSVLVGYGPASAPGRRVKGAARADCAARGAKAPRNDESVALTTFVSHGGGLVSFVDDVRFGLARDNGVVHHDFRRVRHR